MDHDHKTGRVRALLCDNCNHAIGKFKENVDLNHVTLNGKDMGTAEAEAQIEKI